MEEQFILKITWIGSANSRQFNNTDGAVPKSKERRYQYFGPMNKEELDKKMEFYRKKSRYGTGTKMFETFSQFLSDAVMVDVNGNMDKYWLEK